MGQYSSKQAGVRYPIQDTFYGFEKDANIVFGRGFTRATATSETFAYLKRFVKPGRLNEYSIQVIYSEVSNIWFGFHLVDPSAEPA